MECGVNSRTWLVIEPTPRLGKTFIGLQISPDDIIRIPRGYDAVPRWFFLQSLTDEAPPRLAYHGRRDVTLAEKHFEFTAPLLLQVTETHIQLLFDASILQDLAT